MKLGDINDLPSEEAKEAFLEFMKGRNKCSSTCPFFYIDGQACNECCGVLFPSLPKDNWGPLMLVECPCNVYGEEAIKAAQIMVDVYLGYK